MVHSLVHRQPDLLVSSNEKGCEEVARRGDVDFVVRQITLEDFDWSLIEGQFERFTNYSLCAAKRCFELFVM